MLSAQAVHRWVGQVERFGQQDLQVGNCQVGQLI
jgi:hypothetical protein